MRKRFMGKRLAAALLAAAVAFSSGNFAGGYEYVYAAEASVFYTGTNTVTKDKLDLATEDWDNPPMITYDESIADCVTTKDFTMKADITLDDEAYASLGTGESYLKVQGIVKLGVSGHGQTVRISRIYSRAVFQKIHTKQRLRSSLRIRMQMI